MRRSRFSLSLSLFGQLYICHFKKDSSYIQSDMRVLFLLLLATFVTISVTAQRSFECQLVWDEPSSDNSIGDCLGDGKRIKNQMGYFAMAIVSLVLFVVICIALPFVCCSICCGGQSKKLVALDEVLDRNKRLRRKMILVILICLVILSIVFFLHVLGSTMIQLGVGDIIVNIKEQPLAYLMSLRNMTELLIVDHSENPVVPASEINFAAFDTLNSGLEENLDDAHDSYQKYATVVVCVTFIMAAAAIGMGIVALLTAICHFPAIIPSFFGWVAYGAAVVYMLLAVLFFVLAPLVSALCGEVILQYKRQPGLIQWYVLPAVAESVDFSSLRKDIDSLLAEGLEAACSELLDYCKSTSSTEYFTCGGVSSSSDCVSFEYLYVNVLPNVDIASDLSQYCPAPNGYEGDWTCTLSDCVTYCTDSDVRSAAETIISKGDYVSNVTAALSYILPMINSDYIIDIVGSVIEAEPTAKSASYYHGRTSHCSEVKSALWMISFGFFFGSLCLFTVMMLFISIRNSWLS